MGSKQWLMVLTLAGIVSLLSLYPRIYVVRGSAGGVLLWNKTEALLFMGGGNAGARMPYLRYALEPLFASLGHVRPPSDERCLNVTVIRVTHEDAESYDTDVGCVSAYRLFEGQIYAISTPKAWKWSGNRFQPATPDETRSLESQKNISDADLHHPWEFDDIEGWSMRDLRQTPAQHKIVLNNQSVTITFHGPTWPPKPLSVDLTRPGETTKTLWHFDEEPHRVSKAQYARLFFSQQ